jgi:hypothetical protein
MATMTAGGAVDVGDSGQPVTMLGTHARGAVQVASTAGAGGR